jgi:hypothetical protein
MKVAHPEAEMVGVSRDPARLLLAFVEHDVPHTEPPQFGCRRQAGRSTPDDHDATVEQLHGATPQPVKLHSSAWQ